MKIALEFSSFELIILNFPAYFAYYSIRQDKNMGMFDFSVSKCSMHYKVSLVIYSLSRVNK